jgi:hypothetical protein
MLHLRKRGEVWHIRGTVKVGQQNIEVASFNSGCRKKSDGEAVAAAKGSRNQKSPS